MMSTKRREDLYQDTQKDWVTIRSGGDRKRDSTESRSLRKSKEGLGESVVITWEYLST